MHYRYQYVHVYIVMHYRYQYVHVYVPITDTNPIFLPYDICILAENEHFLNHYSIKYTCIL